MAKLTSFFLFCFIGAAILTGIMEGGGGIATTELALTVDADDTTLHVTSTDMFLDADFVVIGEERILYTSDNVTAFLNCTRGHSGTEAVSHVSGSRVYTAETSVVNNALGFNIAATTATVGVFSVVMIPVYFFTRTLPQLVMWNYSFLSGELAILAYFFFAVSAGFVVTLAIQMLQVARGILGR